MPQDFSGQNLRGCSFKGQNLAGANFSYADIRGTNFRHTILIGANFTGAKAGLSNWWIFSLAIISFSVAGVSGFTSGYFSLIISSALNSKFIQTYTLLPIVAIFTIIGIFLFTILQSGLTTALMTLAWIILFCSVLAMLKILANLEEWNYAVNSALAWAISWASAGALARAITDSYWVWIWTGVGALVWTLVAIFVGQPTAIGVIALAGTGGWIIALVGSYIAKQAFSGDKNLKFIRLLGNAIATFGGTSFRDANLTDANFTQAMLKSTDFRNATIVRTCWKNALQLNRARVGNTYLKHPNICQLVTTLHGQEQTFDSLNIEGINLRGANLQDTSFTSANLNYANLQDAFLARAKLRQTQLDGADLTGATLTGAYIEDWGITNTTKLDGARCEYIYMHLPTKDEPDPLRKPDNRQEVFKDGDFADFIKPIIKTLDLYHNQGIDPRAIAISFKELAEKHPEAELRIVGMEVRGEDKFLLRAETAATADKSKLSQEYFQTYNQLKSMPEREIKFLIAEKDSRIHSLENMVVTALQRPNFYTENYHQQGDIIMPEASKQQFNNDFRNAQMAGGLVNANTVSAGQIGGNINNDTSEQKQNLTEVAAEIQKLIQQLEQTNPTTTNFEKMMVVAKAVDNIEKNSTLKTRVIGALKSGGKEALKEAINHPLVNILIASIESCL